MKQIGRTHDGKHLVEVTDNELRAFCMLARVTQRKVVGSAYPGDVCLDTNLVKTFTAIRMWIEQENAVNELHVAVDRMKKVLGVQGGCTCDREKGEAYSECP